MRRSLLALVTLLASSALPASASIAWRIEGIVTEFGHPAASSIPTLDQLGVAEGARFELFLEFNVVTLDTDPSPTRASYHWPFTNASFTVGDLVYPFNPSAPITQNSISHSIYNGVAEYFVGFPLDDAPGVPFRRSYFQLSDADFSDLDGHSFLTVPPSVAGLDPFDRTVLTVVGAAEGSSFWVTGPITAIVLVPEPATAVLLAGGLAALAGHRRRAASSR
jgi:hypothetical protein